MSMDFTEFLRKLGAEPRTEDPGFIAERDSSPEHREAVLRAEAFEDKLERAFDIPAPPDLLETIAALPRSARRARRWWPLAAAASVLVAVGAAGLGWQMNRGWDSVQDYVVDHYRHDGEKMLAMAGENGHGDIHAILAEFDVDAAPELANIINVIKFCPTPGGKGVHMVLNTESGPVTVFYMPGTHVTDHEILAFDGNEAVLVDLENGSAAIIGAGAQGIEDYYAVVHDSIVSLNDSS